MSIRPDQGNFLFLIPARIDFCWPQEIKTQYKTHRIGFLERSLAKTQAWGPQIMSRLAWTTKITALCEVSSCVNSSVFVFLAPVRIIFSIFWDEKQEISLVWPKNEKIYSFFLEPIFYLSKYSLSELYFNTDRLLIEFNGLWYNLAARQVFVAIANPDSLLFG